MRIRQLRRSVTTAEAFLGTLSLIRSSGLHSVAEPSLFPDTEVGVIPTDPPTEEFFRLGESIRRSVKARSGRETLSDVFALAQASEEDLAADYDLAWLTAREKPEPNSLGRVIRVADLFSGCGGMSVGIDEAGRALERSVEHVFAADIDENALKTFSRNLHPSHTSNLPVEKLLDGSLGTRLSDAEKLLKRQLGSIDIAVGGPPCQGHSSLNNHTRREDPKNALYERMARFAEVLEPEHLVIENVPGVRNDRGRVFDRTFAALSKLGYKVDAHKILAETLGVAQRRHRTIVVASRLTDVSEGFLEDVVAKYVRAERSIGWACADLLDIESDHPIDIATEVSGESKARIDWLFENQEYDLPDRLRPACHRTKKHTYKAVYGRLHWDRPAWTITTGFPVMGQGRFLHPLRRRTITPHEAARLQFFPDFFDFGLMKRKEYAQQIGNAVPPKLAYVIALELLR